MDSPKRGEICFVSLVKCNQIRTVDKKRLINFVSTLLPEKLEMIEKALLIHLDVN